MTPSGTFYGGHSGGSCYNTTADFDGDGFDDDIYVWAVNHPDVAIYGNAVAYKVVDRFGTLISRGMHYVGGDITELNVGLYKANTVFKLIVAYWKPNSGNHQIRLATFDMGVTSGLTLASDAVVENCGPITGPTTEALHISLDCHDLTYFTIAWDNTSTIIPDKGIWVMAYQYVPFLGMLLNGPSVHVATGPTLRLPDVAMSHQTMSGAIDVHLAFVDIAGTIYKYNLDFFSLFAGISMTIEDVLPLSGPIGSRFDEFQLKIDAPDHYTAAQSNWSMAYYNNDMNKINLRMCNRALGTPINSYVVNDGSLTGSSGDLTVGAHAFPSVTYHPDGDKVYVAWFSTFDPAGLSPTTLYAYQNFSTRYLSVIVDDLGNQLEQDYQLVDMNYRLNWIYNYPKICLSKNNEGRQLLTLYAGHGPVSIWPWPGSFLSKYTEYPGATPTTGTVTPVVARPYYGGVTHPVTGGTSRYLAHKAVDWYSGSSPYYRKAAVTNTAAITAYPNPFRQDQWFQLGGGNPADIYTARLLSIDGKLIASQNGTVSALNTAFKSLQSQQLSPGVYLLKISDASGKPVQQQRLIKQ